MKAQLKQALSDKKKFKEGFGVGAKAGRNALMRQLLLFHELGQLHRAASANAIASWRNNTTATQLEISLAQTETERDHHQA